MPIILKNKDGVLLKTAGKYCPEDITVVPQLQEKTVTPSETQQTATPDANYAGLDKVTVEAIQTEEVTVTPAQGQQVLEVTDNKYYKKVTVEAIPPDYVIPSGTIQITENGIVDVSGKANANVNVPSKEEETKEVDLAMASGNQTINPTNGKTLSQVVVKKPATMLPENIKKDVNIGGVTGTLESGGGGELNIAYGDTAPEDTSKLWVKTTEPDSVEISPDFGYGEAVQTTGITQNNIFKDVIDLCEFGDSVYLLTSSYVYKMNKFTLNYSTLFTVSNVCSICIFDNKIFYLKEYHKSSSGSWGNSYEQGVQLYQYDLTTRTTSNITANVLLEHYFGKLVSYNNKIYIVGGGRYYSGTTYGVSSQYYSSSGKITIYTPDTNITETFNVSLGYCFNIGVCLIGNKIYTFGGEKEPNDSAEQNNSIYSINLDTQTYEKSSITMLIATSKCGVSNLGNIIYISGGLKTASSVYRYDTVNDTIEQVNVTLEHARASCATFFNGTELYLLGSNAIVDKLQIDVPLSSTKLKIISDWLNNQFAVINGSSKVMIGVNKAFKGDENNKAKEVTAYVHDGVNWHNLDGEITLTKLYAPTISISGKTLTITNDGRNGSKVTNYKVYNGNTLLTTVTATTLDLTTVITANGTYNISVIATGTGYTDSNNSNIVEFSYGVYNITTNLTNVTANASNPTTVSTVASSTLTFTASTGYNLPDNVTVTGAEFTWTKSSGTLVLSNPTGNVSVTIAGVAISYTITPTLTNVTAASGNATTIATGETKVLTYTAASGYTLPDTVTVTGATGVWNKDAGTLTLSNPTANVTFTIAGVEAAVTKYNVEVLHVGGSGTIGNVYDNGTKVGEGGGNYQIISGHKISIDVADNGSISSISTSGGVASDGTVTGDGSYMVEFTCLTGDMLITLADGGQKRIDEITLDDKILSYNPETMRLEEDTITYCDSDEVKTDNKYDVWTFSDGTIVKTVHRHRFYNVERQAMTYMDEWKIGEHAINIASAEIELVSHKVVKENVRHFTIFTENQNYFVNGLLSGNRHTKKMNLPK